MPRYVPVEPPIVIEFHWHAPHDPSPEVVKFTMRSTDAEERYFSEVGVDIITRADLDIIRAGETPHRILAG